MRPQSVGYAAALLMIGGMFGVQWDAILFSATFGLACQACFYGVAVNLFAIFAGLVMLMAGPLPGVRFLGILASLLMIGDFISLDIPAVICGAMALMQVQHVDTFRYYKGTWEPPYASALDAGQTGLAISTSFFFLAFLLFGCVTRCTIDGEEHRLPWGTNAIPLPPGEHEVECTVPYITGNIHTVSKTFTVPESGVLTLKYHAPGWFIFLSGELKEA